MHDIEDIYSGKGQERTLLSGTWRTMLTQAIDVLQLDGWSIVSSWQSDDFIQFVVQAPDGWQSMVLIPDERVSQLEAARTMGSLVYQHNTPKPSVLAKHDDSWAVVTPADDAIQSMLYTECWEACNGDDTQASKLYEELGGQWLV